MSDRERIQQVCEALDRFDRIFESGGDVDMGAVAIDYMRRVLRRALLHEAYFSVENQPSITTVVHPVPTNAPPIPFT